MPNLTADRVKETTTTTGTGTVTLAGAVAQFRTFASAFADGSVVQYAIVGQTGTEWEVGNGTFTASGTTLARTTVLASSNAGAAVNFSAGTKDVFATVTAAHLLATIELQGSTPGTAQTGSANISGSAVVGTKITTPSVVGGASGTSTLTLDGDSSVAGSVTIGSAGDITVPQTPSGTYGYKFEGLSDAGLQAYSSGNVALASASGKYLVFRCGSSGLALFDVYGFVMLHGGQYKWDTFGGVGNTGLTRLANGVVGATDGSVGVRGLLGGGAAVASAAALPVPTGRVFHVTGTTNITSITSTNFQAGVAITMIFDGVLTVTDGSNLKLAGNFVTAADSTLSLVYDGTNWFETSRSTN